MPFEKPPMVAPGLKESGKTGTIYKLYIIIYINIYKYVFMKNRELSDYRKWSDVTVKETRHVEVLHAIKVLNHIMNILNQEFNRKLFMC